MTIKKKLILSFTLILLILFAIGVTAVISLSKVNDTSTVINSELLPRINCIEDLNYNIAKYRSYEYEHIIQKDAEEKAKLETEMNDIQKTVESEIDTYKSYSADDNIGIISRDWNIYKTEHNKLITESQALDTEGAMAVLMGQSKTEYDKIVDVGKDILNENNANVAAQSQNGKDTYVLARGILIAAIILAVLLGSGIELLIIRSIRVPLKKMELKLQDLVNNGGDLTQNIDIKSKDEIGMLANQVNRFIQNIRTIIVEVNGASEGVEHAVGTIASYMKQLTENVELSSATVQELSAGMEETAASAQEVDSSATEIEGAVASMAERAHQGAGSAEKISNRAEQLQTDAVKSRDSVREIYQSTKQSLEGALEKSTAINQINVLSDTILQISGQTNLLALNAAIEAARAGEAGKGFAVVADEIRTLAENSKKTVSEIQQVTQEVVSSVSALTESTKAFMEFFDSTVIPDYDAMVTTGEAYGKDGRFVHSLVGDFSATAKELTATTEGIMKAMGEVTATVNEGAGGTQDIAGKIAQIVGMVGQVQVQMDVGLENTTILKSAVNKFVV